MNPDTGEIREFPNDAILPKCWIEWQLYEKVEIKGCLFQVIAINIAENTITLKGMGKTQVK